MSMATCAARLLFQSTLPAWGATGSRSALQATSNHFNPRSPHGERPMAIATCAAVLVFQSTLPAWGATTSHLCTTRHQWYFNPRSPHGERLLNPHQPDHQCLISIHAPRMGSDLAASLGWIDPLKISIHAPRMGSDYAQNSEQTFLMNFNPRSPHGERLPIFTWQ